jgi:two-component system, chemotaxis family, sensor kinase CheA
MSDNLSADQIEIIQEFVQESRDMIDQLEPTIIELGQSEDGEKTINAIFRLFHSMKGSAGFLELNHITRVAHAAESLLDLMRSGSIQLHPTHVNLLCETCDFAKEALEHVENSFDDHAMEESAEITAARLEQAISEANASAETASANDPTAAPQKETDEENGLDLQLSITPDMVERFVQEADELLQNAEQGLLTWEKNPDNSDIVAELFRNIHSFKGNCGFFGYADLERLSHQMETVLDVAKSGVDLLGENPTELLLQLVDVLREAITDISQGGIGQVENKEQYIEPLKKLLEPRLGELLVEKGLVDEKSVSEALEAQKKPIGEILIDMGKVKPEQVDQTLKEQQEIKTKKEASSKDKNAAAKRQDIRVDLEKLDNLINLIGEMVIAENMLIHNPDLEGLELENFGKAAQQMSKIVRELQEMAMIIRMIPVAGLFRRMIRLVHDLSVKSGKKVELKLYGQETEVDKTVIETITDPLVHLLRNSMDHGLEPPEERRKAGKPEKGEIRLSARHEEGEVWITLEDDGRGLNREKIIAKAISNGLIEGDGSDLSDKAVYNLIFQPGFSTAEKITDISGRGVGMDVVKQNLDKIKGRVEVHSKPGLGTKIILRIPLTLAIIDGMLVRVGDTRCIVPILAIKEAFRPTPKAITVTPDGEELARIRENFFPVVRLHQILQKTPDHMELQEGILIVLEYQDKRICLLVDEILGQQQTVIKALSDYIGNVRGCSGCTILGNGEVCLILDIGTMMEIAEDERIQVAAAS